MFYDCFVLFDPYIFATLTKKNNLYSFYCFVLLCFLICVNSYSVTEGLCFKKLTLLLEKFLCLLNFFHIFAHYNNKLQSILLDICQHNVGINYKGEGKG